MASIGGADERKRPDDDDDDDDKHDSDDEIEEQEEHDSDEDEDDEDTEDEDDEMNAAAAAAGSKKKSKFSGKTVEKFTEADAGAETITDKGDIDTINPEEKAKKPVLDLAAEPKILVKIIKHEKFLELKKATEESAAADHKEEEDDLEIDMSDNYEMFKIPRAALKISETLEPSIAGHIGDEIPIMLAGITTKSWPLVQEYLEHYAEPDNLVYDEDDNVWRIPEIEKPLRDSNNLKDSGATDWDVAYIEKIVKLDPEGGCKDSYFNNVYEASMNLRIEGLHELCCARVMIEQPARTAEELRTLFNIPNDFTKEEQEIIEKEAEWLSSWGER